jgi:hypothetical protein
MISSMTLLLCYSLVPFVSASSSTVLGSTSGLDQNEINAEGNVTSEIAYYASHANYSAYDWYGADTTTSNIYTAASGNGAYADYVPRSMAFYIGHGNFCYYPQSTQWFILNKDGWPVYDYDIFDHSSKMQLRFVFLWSCEQGDVIGGPFVPFHGGPYGMPYAWLHTTSLSNDSYANPDNSRQCFIGFSGPAPQLTDTYPPDTGSWITMFYGYALQPDNLINDALDFASEVIYGSIYGTTSFSNCILRTGFYLNSGDPLSKMVTYGQGNMDLQPANPLVAEKTGTDGHFNLPDPTFVPWSALEIKMLFDQTNLTGDQTGGGSPYSEIAHYPSGSVMGDDIAFIGRQFGTYEGETTPTKWDYMADSVPPWGRVDGKDLATAARNFGAFGGNITDLSGVSVAYYEGWTHECDWTPNADGFVNIPPDATSFNVTRNGIPIGATVVFWGP